MNIVLRLRLTRLISIAAVLATIPCCHRPGARAGIGRDAASCIPDDAVLLARVDLDRLRASAAFPVMPQAAREFLAPYAAGSSLVVAWAPHAVLMLAAGNFQQAPPGAILANSHLALAGAGDAVRAALARYRSHADSRSGLLEYAAQAVGDRPLWLAVRGGIRFPLRGNAANLNRLLQPLDYAGVALSFASPEQLQIRARAANADLARQFEESLRAFLSLAAAGEARRPELAGLLTSARVDREDREITATIPVPAAELGKLLSVLVPY